MNVPADVTWVFELLNWLETIFWWAALFIALDILDGPFYAAQKWFAKRFNRRSK